MWVLTPRLFTKSLADRAWVVLGSRVGGGAGCELVGFGLVGFVPARFELIGWLAVCWQAMSIRLESSSRRVLVMFSQSFRSHGF